jgi:hypothetical protein
VDDVREAARGASNDFQRIDRPHAESASLVGKQPFVKPAGRKSRAPIQHVEIKEKIDEGRVSTPESRPHDTYPESWLRLHAADLIDRLSNWSQDLDAREAQLNARIAKEDLRERQFRLHQQVALAEMDEQQRAVDRLRKEIEDHARRLAFQDT